MGIRQTINEKPQITMAVTGAIILIALLYIAVHTFGGGPASHAVKPLAFFSDDDGQTYFVDDGVKIPPFDHNGKQAYKAMVYRCEGGKPFVAYLQRCNDEQRAQFEAAAAKGDTPAVGNMLALSIPLESKKPGQKNWVSANGKGGYPEYQRATMPVCPEGGSGKPLPVLPSDKDNGATGS